MAASRELPFSLVIVCLVLIRGHAPLPTTGMNPERPPKPHGFSTEDYSQLEDTVTPVIPIIRVSPVGGTMKKCDYDPCLEGQVTCAKLAVSTFCLCPGLTLHNIPPEAPILSSLSWNGSEVVTRWCAPYSYVTSYIVIVGKERQTFGADQRSARVGHLAPMTEVCVVAVNDAGDSDEACKVFQPRDDALPLKAGLIGGALGLLLLLLLAVLLWKRKTQRKQEAGISMRVTAGTQSTENRAGRDAQ